MATTTVEIQMPAMGESVTEGRCWSGTSTRAFVEEGETVVEVSTDKVDAEVPAPASGVITKILAQADETVKVGQALAELDPAARRRVRQRRVGGDAQTEARARHGGGSELVEGGGEGDEDIGERPEDRGVAAPGDGASRPLPTGETPAPRPPRRDRRSC